MSQLIPHRWEYPYFLSVLQWSLYSVGFHLPNRFIEFLNQPRYSPLSLLISNIFDTREGDR